MILNVETKRNTMRNVAVVAIVGAFFGAFGLLRPAEAFTFDKNFLISDGELENATYLSMNGIQNFLAERSSILASTEATDLDGETRSVAGIIKNAAAKYTLNPMMFLVMAQKESSAVTAQSMSYAIENWILGYGRCDSCSEEQAAPYRGIAKQFDSAGSRIRNGYLADLEGGGTTISGWAVGRTKTTIDGIEVTPQNNATAALYTYNPCVGAYGGGYSQFGCNSAFQKIWQDWNPSITKYPNGTLLQISGVVYLIEDGLKRPFTSRGALISNHDERKVIQAPSIVGEQYKKGAPFSYPNYSLVRSPAGTIYLIQNGKKRGIASQEAFRQLGYNPDEVLNARWSEVDPIPEGPSITASAQFPMGALVQNQSTGAVAFVNRKGTKRDIWDEAILENRYAHRPIEALPAPEFNSFKKGAPAKFRDGALVTTPKGGIVYVIANGRKKPIDSAAAFEAYGYAWENVVTVPKKTLSVHKKGKVLKVPSKKKNKSKK